MVQLYRPTWRWLRLPRYPHRGLAYWRFRARRTAQWRQGRPSRRRVADQQLAPVYFRNLQRRFWYLRRLPTPLSGADRRFRRITLKPLRMGRGRPSNLRVEARTYRATEGMPHWPRTWRGRLRPLISFRRGRFRVRRG